MSPNDDDYDYDDFYEDVIFLVKNYMYKVFENYLHFQVFFPV